MYWLNGQGVIKEVISISSYLLAYDLKLQRYAAAFLIVLAVRAIKEQRLVLDCIMMHHSIDLYLIV